MGPSTVLSLFTLLFGLLAVPSPAVARTSMDVINRGRLPRFREKLPRFGALLRGRYIPRVTLQDTATRRQVRTIANLVDRARIIDSAVVAKFGDNVTFRQMATVGWPKEPSRPSHVATQVKEWRLLLNRRGQFKLQHLTRRTTNSRRERLDYETSRDYGLPDPLFEYSIRPVTRTGYRWVTVPMKSDVVNKLKAADLEAALQKMTTMSPRDLRSSAGPAIARPPATNIW
jgi:hypothetical protein